MFPVALSALRAPLTQFNGHADVLRTSSKVCATPDAMSTNLTRIAPGLGALLGAKVGVQSINFSEAYSALHSI